MLHQLGYRPQSHKKGAYVNGYEREDVVRSREEFLKKLKETKENLCHHRPAVMKELPRLHQMLRRGRS